MKNLKDYRIQKINKKFCASNLLVDLLADLMSMCLENPEEYKEQLKIMEDTQKSIMEQYGDARADEAVAFHSIEIAKKLLDKLSDDDIADAIGLSVDQVEMLRATNELL